MVHINYHPDKEARAQAVFRCEDWLGSALSCCPAMSVTDVLLLGADYLEGDDNALKPFPGGSEPGS